MAYPFAQMPTLADFIERAKGYGVTLKTAGGQATGPRGPVQFRYLKRANGRFVILPDMADSERLTPIVLSSFCRQLGIPLSEFDLDLGGLDS